MEFCKHHSTIEFCALCAQEINTTSDLLSSLVSTEIEKLAAVATVEKARPHWANGSKPTAALCDVITMLEPLSSEQRAKVIAATSAWFEGEA